MRRGFWVKKKGGAWGGRNGEGKRRKEGKKYFPSPPFHDEFHGRVDGGDRLEKGDKGGEKIKNVKKLDKGIRKLGMRREGRLNTG
jgi:hypothetical protein